MGQRVLVGCLLLLSFRCDSAQYVANLQANQAITTTEKTLSELINMSDNALPDFTSNETRADMETGSLDALQNISVPRGNPTGSKESVSDTLNALKVLSAMQYTDVHQNNLSATKEIVSDTHVGMKNLSDIYMMESHLKESNIINTVNETFNGTSSKSGSQYPNNTIHNTTDYVLNAERIAHKLQMAAHGINGEDNTRERNSSDAMIFVLPDNNNINETYVINDKTVNNIVDTTDETLYVSQLPPVLNKTPVAEIVNETSQTLEIVNVSESDETRLETNITTVNSFSDNNHELPEIKWRPGMKQPQTITDLIRIAGADIRFIRTQFGGNFSVIGNVTYTPTENEETVTENGEENIGIKAADRHKLNTSQELPLIQNTILIQEPQLSNTKVRNPIAVSSRQSAEEDDSMNSDTVNVPTTESESDDIPPNLLKLEDGFVTSKTLNSFLPDVVVRKRTDDESRRLEYVPNINSHAANVQNVPDSITGGSNRQTGERSETNLVNIPTDRVRQSGGTSQRIISFGNNPEYVLGTSNSGQIPQSLIQNHMSIGDLSNRLGNRQNNEAVLTDFSETGINAGLNRISSITRVPTDERMSIFLDTRLENSQGLPRSGSFRGDTSRQINVPDRGIPRTQGGVRMNSMFDRSNGFMPRRNDVRSSPAEIPFANIPARRRLDTGQVSDRSIGIPSVSFSNNIPTEGRQNIGTISSVVSPQAFQRTGSFDRSIDGSRFLTSRGSLVTRNSDVTSGFIHPRQFDERIIPRSDRFATERPFPSLTSAIGFRDEIIRSRLTRPEVFPTFRDLRGIGPPPMFPVETRTFDAPIRPPVILTRPTFMPIDMFPPFSPRAPFPFL